MPDLIPPPTFDEWRRILGGARRTAWHLEMRDAYSMVDETEEFEAWKRGHRDDPDDRASWWRPWLDLMSETAARGVDLRRVRIVSEPVSEYILFEYDGTFTNVAAGENVRWLSRREASHILLPGNDFWLFDRDAAMFNHFSGDGDWLAIETRSESAIVEACHRAFESAWTGAVPHDQYDPRSPVPQP